MRKPFILFLIPAILTGCRPSQRDDLSNTFSVEVFNPSAESRKNIPLFIPLDSLQAKHADFNPNAFYIVDREAEIASQFNSSEHDVQGIFVVIDSLRGNERRNLSVYFSKQGNIKRNYTKKTQAELSHRVGGEWRGREYAGGHFQNVDYLRVPPEHKDHSYFIRYEGPGWESDKVGYRFYLDQRNATDVFGKKTSDMVLMGVGQDGFDSYHNMQSWGMDVMKVGKSLGIGSIGKWVDTSAVRVEKTDSITSRILENGNIYSAIQTKYYGWKAGNDTINVDSRLSIYSGTRWTQYKIGTGKETQVATGLVKDKTAKLIKDSGNETSFGYMLTYGKQSLNNDKLGIAVIFDSKDFAAFKEDAFSHVVELNARNGSVQYYFAAAWELEKEGITSEEQFINYVKRAARELAKPVEISIK